MGLFDKLKKQALSVIEWTDDSKETIVFKYEVKDRYAIMNSSTLVVRPSQVALFVHRGQVADIFGPGSYKLSTGNIPIITKLLNIPTLGDNPITVDIYYINTKQFSGLKWGTPNPIMLRDAEFGAVRLRGFGVYSFKVDDPKKFMEEMFGTNSVYTVADVAEQVKPMVIQAFTDALAESKISALDLAANYREFGKTICEQSVEEFSNFGLKLVTAVIENISLPEEVEKVLDKRSSVGIMEDKMGSYAQYEAINAMGTAAKNPGNNMANMGMNMATGVMMGQMYGQQISNAKNTAKAPQPENTVKEEAPAPKAAAGGKTCSGCGASVPAGSKFCPECGQKMPVAKFCPECGAKAGEGAKFCPECGTKLA